MIKRNAEKVRKNIKPDRKQLWSKTIVTPTAYHIKFIRIFLVQGIIKIDQELIFRL